MNKLEFLTRLRNALERGGLPSEDINDALSYYEEVFLDAGFGKEEETAASMGSPEAVAANILRESGINPPVPAMQRRGAVPPPQPQQKKKSSGGAIALSIILGIITFPIWLPILIIVVTFLFVAIVLLISLVIGFIGLAVGLLFGGVAALIHVPSVGLMMLGAGLFMTGIVILICRPAFSAAIPACGRGIKRFCSWLAGLFKKGGKENA
ncbi:MAG: DUF1700 domain-containing protein [Ruminococcus sp.]|nr:DUF1700 domain-containing protein [Ruminococcus sp.]